MKNQTPPNIIINNNKNEHLPKKLLRIDNLTFVLPDNFNGNLQNALMLLAAYLNIEFRNGNFKPNKDSTIKKSIFNDGKDDSCRVTMKYGIFEMDENGDYKLK